MFISTLFSDPRAFATITLIVIFSICLHEYMHAWVALKMGDPTAALHGHLTMNPFKQMGLMSLIMLALIGIAWGQVPVNPDNLPTRKKRIAVALAGVCANIFLAICFTVLIALLICFASQHEFAIQMLLRGAVINLLLFFINIMPLPGLDGFNILREFLHINSQKSKEIANVVFFILMMLLIFSIDDIVRFSGNLIISFLKLILEGTLQ